MPIDDEIRTILGGPVPRRTASSRSVRKTLLAVERVSANVNTASGVSLRFKPRRQCTSPKKTHPRVRDGCSVAREANNFDMQRGMGCELVGGGSKNRLPATHTPMGAARSAARPQAFSTKKGLKALKTRTIEPSHRHNETHGGSLKYQSPIAKPTHHRHCGGLAQHGSSTANDSSGLGLAHRRGG
jgi:hypothetical protein